MTINELTAQPWFRPALLAVLGLAALVLLGRLLRRRQRWKAPPQWRRVVADTDYYRQVLGVLFPTRGYQVAGYRVFKDPLEDEEREIIFSLRKDGQMYAALCVRWIVPVTSEIVGRFEQALAASKAERGLIVTTSVFSAAARERAMGLPVLLYDREDLKVWIGELWG